MQPRSVYGAFVATTQRFGDHDFLYLVSDTASRYGIPSGAVTYQQALDVVDRLVDQYGRLGLAIGERVVLGLDNRPEFFYHWLAINALGASVVPLNPEWQAGELEYVFEHSEPHWVVCLPDKVELLTAVTESLSGQVNIQSTDSWPDESVDTGSERVLPNDSRLECALLYTSGTTGKPKGCLLSNEYFLVSGAWYRDLGGLCEITEGKERLLTPLPMYHMNAMATSTMVMLMTGGCIVPLDRFHPASFWESVVDSGATILHYLGVMPVLLMASESVLQDREHDIRFGFGAGLSGDLHRQFEERFGFKLIEAWAMTETGCGVAVIANREPRKVGTACIGRVPENVDFRLVDDAGQDVTRGDAGELWIRYRGGNPRYGFFSGYLKDVDATAAAWKDGYFHTGDLVREDEGGCLHFVDRKKNVIRRSGENISAVEVERIVLEHSAVVAVGVAAVPDDVRGDEVFAVIVTDVDVEQWPVVARDIARHCLDRLAYFKAPGYLSRCDALPLTPTEKVHRAELKLLAQTLVANGDYVDTRAMKTRRG